MILTVQQCANLIQAGKINEAIQSLRKILAKNAKQAEPHHLIGVAYTMAGDYKLAEKHLLKTLKLNPTHWDAEYNLARLYTEIKKFSRAKSGLVKVLKHRPDWLQAHFALGLAAIGLKDTALAKSCFQEVVNKHPQNFEAWCNLGNICIEQRDYQQAKESYQRSLDCNPSHEEAVMGLYRALKELNLLSDVVTMLLKYREYLPTSKMDLELARSYRLLGDKTQACTYAKQAFVKDNTNGEAYRLYFDSIDVSDVAQLGPLFEALEQPDLADGDKKSLHFALSKGLESCGDYVQAVTHLDAANAYARQELDYSTSKTIAKFEMLKKAYSHHNGFDGDGAGEQGQGLVFILGMPRSGTSLVEQIVASHSDVYGAGELTQLGQLWRKVGAASEYKFHTKMQKQSVEQWQKVGQAYLDYVFDLKGDCGFITDKMPHNFQYIGLITTLFPSAKIVHCKRHPVANCLSIYKANFNSSHGYAFNQKELAEYHNLYEDLMDHWRKVLPGKFYEIKYEDLTTNQEQETRKLIEYCGLEWQDACLDFHNNKRAVKTASAYQVRQKMHNKSVDLWKRYGDGLQPLIDNLYIPEEYQ